MRSGNVRRDRWGAVFRKRCGRLVSTACAVSGAVALIAAGPAAGEAAADVQPQQWYLSAMKADAMWKVSTGKGIKVAVIDSGINSDTPSLRGQVLTEEVPRSVSYGATKDYEGHGTTMAELIAGTGAGGGLKGLAPDAKILSIRIKLDSLTDKEERRKTATSAQAIRAAADTDAQIISMSFGAPGSEPEEEAAIKYAHSKGKLMFAGVGNGGEESGSIDYPAGYPYVVGVAASDENGKVAKFSDYGNYVDLASPGLNVPTWCNSTFRSYCTGQGTSHATAIASASAALVWSAHPDWTANQVLGSLIDTAGRDWARDDPSTYLGYGLIRPRKVLENERYSPIAADTDPLEVENSVGVMDEDGTPTPSNASGTPKPGKGGSAAADAEADTSSNTAWMVAGAGVGVLVLGGAVFAFIRPRRRA